MTSKKILMVNENTQDIMAIKERLPETIRVLAANHWQARHVEGFNVDCIVVDNDANDRQEARGPETVKAIRALNDTVPIVYTSFTPGWVSDEVRKSGAEIVRTTDLVSHLAERYSFEPRKTPVNAAAEPEMSIIISYNPVSGFEPDIYGNGKLLVASFDKNARKDARRVLTEQVDKLYANFDWRKDRTRIRNIFVYDGLNGQGIPGEIASALSHDVRMEVNVLGCMCDWERKTRLNSRRDLKLYQVHCGGYEELGSIADAILGIERVKPGTLPVGMTREDILRPARRFDL